jgi:D-inositol-3-phosphate glycosyltransferase
MTKRIAILSMHTSPLAQPGTGDGGGMNVYVRELAAALARKGHRCDVFTRSTSADLARSVVLEPGFVVHHVAAGAESPMAKEDLGAVVPEFTDRVLSQMTTASGSPLSAADGGPYDIVHGNYWLSGLAGHIIKHELDLPLVSTFHTLDRVKAEAVPEERDAPWRADAETTIIGCSDAVLASCSVEAEQLMSLYGARPEQVEIVAPGVDHAFFAPGNRAQARRALHLPDTGPLLLFVGRIQPLKGANVALEALALLRAQGQRATLVIVGGPSGVHGEATMAQLHEFVAQHHLEDAVIFRPPQPHELLSSYYRAADVTICPSRSESFGLVALESATCGTPTIASAVGGLTTVIQDGVTGVLVEGHDPGAFAFAASKLLEDRHGYDTMAHAAVLDARRYSWRAAAERLDDLFERLCSRQLVSCR